MGQLRHAVRALSHRVSSMRVAGRNGDPRSSRIRPAVGDQAGSLTEKRNTCVFLCLIVCVCVCVCVCGVPSPQSASLLTLHVLVHARACSCVLCALILHDNMAAPEHDDDWIKISQYVSKLNPAILKDATEALKVCTRRGQPVCCLHASCKARHAEMPRLTAARKVARRGRVAAVVHRRVRQPRVGHQHFLYFVKDGR